MPNKKRVEHYAKWSVARSANTVDFWKIIEYLFERRGVKFSKKHLAIITHINIDELANDKDLDITTRHHIFVTVQWAVRKSRSKEKIRKYKKNDPEGTTLSSLRCRHEELTGENKPLCYWEDIVAERYRLQNKFKVRYKIKRIDSSDGFYVENLEIVKVKADKVT